MRRAVTWLLWSPRRFAVVVVAAVVAVVFVVPALARSADGGDGRDVIGGDPHRRSLAAQPAGGDPAQRCGATAERWARAFGSAEPDDAAWRAGVAEWTDPTARSAFAAIDRVAVPQGEPRSSQTSIDDHGRCTTLVDLSGGVQIETVLIDRGPGPLVVQWGPP